MKFFNFSENSSEKRFVAVAEVKEKTMKALLGIMEDDFNVFNNRIKAFGYPLVLALILHIVNSFRYKFNGISVNNFYFRNIQDGTSFESPAFTDHL